MKKIAVLPSLLTLGNAFCGLLAISYCMDAVLYSFQNANPDFAVFQGVINKAAWLIMGAMVFDALDGKVARMTHYTSDFGGQLDSLCDAVSFGVAPALLAKVLVDYEIRLQGATPHPKIYFLAAALFAICAILRLARFNVENEHADDAHTHFKGLPTPAAAGVIATTVLLYLGFADSRTAKFLNENLGWEAQSVAQGIGAFLPFALFVLGLLMVSRFRYTHMVNYALRDKKPFAFLIQLILLLVIAAIEPELALAAAFFGFAISGPVLWLKNRFRSRRTVAGEKTELTEKLNS